MEPRRLLVALVVNGGGGDDHIFVRVDNDWIYPFVNNILIPQPRAAYDSITVNGFGGNDDILIKNTRSEPVDIFPGDGADKVSVCAYISFDTADPPTDDLDVINARVYVHAGTDGTNDTLQISDSADAGSDEYDIVEDGPMKLRKPNATSPDKVFWGESNLHTTIFVSNHDDTINLDSTVAMGGTDETLTIDASDAGIGSFDANQQLNFSGTISNGNLLEFIGDNGDNTMIVTGDVFAGDATIRFTGGLGVDLLTVSDPAATGTYTFDAAGTRLTLLQGTQTGVFDYSGLSNIGLSSTSTTQASTFNIDGVGADLTIAAGGGNDTFVVGDGTISTADFGTTVDLILQGGSGTDSITFDDNASNGAYALSFGDEVYDHPNLGTVTCDSCATATLNMGAGAETLTLGGDHGAFTSVVVNGGGGADTFNVKPDVGTTITLNGQSPTTVPGDDLNLTANGATGGTLDTTSATAGTYSFPGRGDITFTGMESFTQPGSPPSPPNLNTADDTGRSATDNITRKTSLGFTGTGAGANGLVRLFRGSFQAATTTADSTGRYSFSSVSFPGGDNTFAMTTTRDDTVTGLISNPSTVLSLRVDATVPAQPPTPDVAPSSDSGKFDNDNFTNVTTPEMIGTVERSAIVRLFTGSIEVASVTADVTDGSYDVQTGVLVNGSYVMDATQEDVAGNVSSHSPPLLLSIDTIAPNNPSAPPDLQSASDSGLSQTDNITNVKTPTFTVNGTGADFVRLLVGDTIIADYAQPPNITSGSLADGVYAIAARGIDLAGNLSAQTTATLQVTIDTVAPAAPTAAPDLQPAADLGFSNTDNITSVVAPTFTVNGPELIRLVEGATVLAAFATPPNVTSSSLADGLHNIAARSVDVAGNVSTGVTTSLGVTIDSQPPLITAKSFTFDTAPAVNFTFSEDVLPTLAINDFSVQNLSIPTTLPLATMSLSTSPGNVASFATITFPGFPDGLPDGNYRAAVIPGGVTDRAGNILFATNNANLLEFFVFAGDANHDRAVDFNDLVILAQHYNQVGGATYTTGDFNYDQNVDFNDLVLLAQRYNTTLAPPPPPPIPASAATAPAVLIADAATPTLFSTKPIVSSVLRKPARRPHGRSL